MRFIVQPDGVYLAIGDREAMLLPGVSFDFKANAVDVSSLPVDIAIEGIVLENAKELLVVDGELVVKLIDDSVIEADKLRAYARRIEATRIDATKSDEATADIEDAIEVRR